MGVTPADSPNPPVRLGRGRGDRFGLLLLVLVTSYLISAFTTGVLVNAVQVVLFAWVAALALRSEGVRRRTAQLVIIVAVVGSTAALALALTHTAEASVGLANAWTAVILLFSAVLIVRRVLTQPEVTLQSIYGAISAYMIIGLMFAALYGAMYRFGGDTFFSQGAVGNSKTFQYFSFTTLTTLGYGDYTAGESGGQAVAVMEAMVGQVFLATLVARLVAAFRGPQPKAGGQPPRARPGPQSPQGTQPQAAPADLRPAPARRWRPPPTGRQRRLLAARQPARQPPIRSSSSPSRARRGRK
jgi:Ion channel